MDTGVKNLTGSKVVLLTVGIVALSGAIYLLRSYWDVVIVLGVLVLFCVAAYQAGKMRPR